jgi:hypothetical protein
MILVRTTLLAVGFCLAAAHPASALEGYAFVAPGALTAVGFTNGTLHVGGGAEHVLGSGIGLGAEIGAVGSWRNYGTAIGMFSVNGSYHFLRDRQRIDPFVTAGYSLGFRSGTLNFGNFGGGLNYWFSERIVLRIELRDHVHVSSRVPDLHYWSIRFGVAFR